MKVYISAPFTSKSVPSNGYSRGLIVDNSYINFLDSIESSIRSLGHDTILPHRDIHEWGRAKTLESEIGKKSFDAVKSSDLIVAYPENSVGVNIELGWASALDKNILVLLNETQQVSIMYVGLVGLGKAKMIKFRDIMDLRSKLIEEVQKIGK